MIKVRMRETDWDEGYIDLILPALPPIGTDFRFEYPVDLPVGVDEFALTVKAVSWVPWLPDGYVIYGDVPMKSAMLGEEIVTRRDFVAAGWRLGDAWNDPFEPCKPFVARG